MKALGRAIGAIGATVALMGALAMPGAAWAEEADSPAANGRGNASHPASASAVAVDDGNDSWTLRHTLTGGSLTTSDPQSIPVTAYVTYDDSSSMANRKTDMEAALSQIARTILANPQSQLYVMGDHCWQDGMGTWADVTPERITDPSHDFTVDALRGDDQHAAGWELMIRHAANNYSNNPIGNPVVAIQVGDASDPEVKMSGSIVQDSQAVKYTLTSWDPSWYRNITQGVYGSGNVTKYIVGFVGENGTDTGAASRCAESVGATYLDGSNTKGLQDAFQVITTEMTTTESVTTGPELSFRLTEHVTPAWTTFSRSDVTLTTSDGSPLPNGWTASWNASTRTVRVTLPSDYELRGSITASIHVTSAGGEGDATADAKWTSTLGGTGSELRMSPLRTSAPTPPTALGRVDWGDLNLRSPEYTIRRDKGGERVVAPHLSLRLTDHVTPDWETFSRSAITLTLSDGSQPPAGWTASWNEDTREITVVMPSDWELDEGVSLQVKFDLRIEAGTHDMTSTAVWAYRSSPTAEEGHLYVDPLRHVWDPPVSATLPATGGLMAAVGFAAVMLGAAALLARMRARTVLNG